MNFIMEILNKEIFKKILVFMFLIICLYLLRSMLDLLLLTFLFAYLISSLQNFIVNKIKKYIPIKEKIITMILYLLIIVAIVVIVYKYIPLLVIQSVAIINQAQDWYSSSYINSTQFGKYLEPMIAKIDIASYTKSGLTFIIEFATNVGKLSANVFGALILSLFFILEKNSVIKFLQKFRKSKMAGLSYYLGCFMNNFLNSFGNVIKAQIVIAFVNTIVSVIFLSIIGFSNLLALGFMIFALSLIPVAGVIISLVPLCLIAFKIGGFIKIVYVLIMVVVVHSMESYLLNPKLMSAKTELPIFFTFTILIVSEHFMGIWGLLLGIPLFMFVMDLLEVPVIEKETKSIEGS